MAITEVASNTFEKVVIEASKEKPVVVDFWAPWCGPCHMISPVVEELDKEYDGAISFCKVNTDECPDIASRYNVMSIPTLLLIKDGDVKETVVGVTPKAALKKKFDEHIGD
ncbi:MAG: thioredoxin [bacterium]|nr:thioredoxin [bacterium]